ncbi:MFS general substrate transporter [Hesseltinella vesiculosa]|uniref:MFS general substrate transporter n=1 Tax=Hesseltinella vesiculosa TaxID=101127 RepID=A0A1X2GRT0_9FUNG|nr:MFS general substrate transporter [Hesseltinella vesiculosa]
MQDYFDRQVFRGSVDVTQLSFVGTIGFSFCGLMGPVSQLFTSIIGVRWVMLIGTILMSTGLILASFSVEVWHLYLTQSVIHGMGAAVLYVVSMAVTPPWFQRRGLALGIMVSGSGVGGLVMPFIMTELNETLGGAWCYRILGIVTLGVGLMSTLLLKEKEADKSPLRLRHVIDIGLCKDLRFVIWCVAGNLNMLAYFIPAFYLPSHTTKLGLPPSQGSMLVAIFSAVNVVGRVFSGYLGDRIGAVNVDILLMLVCGLSSLFIWTLATSYISLMAFIIIYGFASGAVADIPFLFIVAPITATITGIAKYPSGISLCLFSMTAARLGPSMAGAIQSAVDKNGFAALQIFTGCAFILSSMVMVVLKYKLQPGLLGKI